jgi:hypothetical protein
MIPPKTLNVLRSSQTLKRFRDCPRLATLPYATYGNAHQIKLAAEILSAALYWRSEWFRSRKRSSTVKSTVQSTLKSTLKAVGNAVENPTVKPAVPPKTIVPVPDLNQPAPVLTLVEPLGEE